MRTFTPGSLTYLLSRLREITSSIKSASSSWSAVSWIVLRSLSTRGERTRERERPDLPIPARLINEDRVTRTSEGPLANCSKLGFNPSELDEYGLVGPVGGKVALSYEFCVPRDERVVNEVRSIDPSVAIQAGSPGRVGCGPTEVLCVGSTNQTDHLGVLARLCGLEYVNRIERAHFE